MLTEPALRRAVDTELTCVLGQLRCKLLGVSSRSHPSMLRSAALKREEVENQSTRGHLA